MSLGLESDGSTFLEEYLPIDVAQDSVVVIASPYGLDGLWIESRWGRDFPHPYIPALRPAHTPIQWVPGVFPGGKAAGAWR
jgi:hypothetical protein